MSATREFISVAGFPIYWYGIIIAAAITTAIACALKREESFGLKKDTMLDAALICVPAGIIGARLYYVAMKPGEFSTFMSVIDLRSGGLAIYGGLIAGFAAALIFARVRRVSFITLLDVAAPCIALAQGIGRWGNFFNQEAYGVQITTEALQFFPFAVYIESEGAWFAATFFYESVWCLFTAFTVFRLRRPEKGIPAAVYLMMYACERCAVEGLRTDSLYLGSVRISQALSAVILISLCVYFCIRNRKRLQLYITIGFSALLAVSVAVSNVAITFAICAVMGMLGVNSTKSLPVTAKKQL